MSNKLIKNETSQSNNKKFTTKQNIIAIVICALILVIAVVIVVTRKDNDDDKDKSEAAKMNNGYSYIDVEVSDDESLSGKYYAEIKVAEYGDIVVVLDADTAPISVTNFVKLVGEGFYDNLTFHRIIKGFMIQGGDPKHNGTGGSDETIVGEFKTNGIDNDISHKRGILSMARSMENNSGSSQFFICHDDSPHLDGNYAGFGWVYGANGEDEVAFETYMEVVDNICEEVPVTDNNGTVEFKNQPVITSIKMIEFN